MKPPERRTTWEAAAAAAAGVLAILALAVSWAPLYSDVPIGHVAAIGVLAALPAAAALSPRGGRLLLLAAGVVALVGGLALALRISPPALLATPAGWREIAALVPHGLSAASSSNLPVAHAREPALTALLDMALLGLAGAAAWQASTRRTPLWAVVALSAGLAYRWTVLPPERPALAGALGLGVVLAILLLVGTPFTRGLPGRRVTSGAVVGGVALVAALVVASGPARTSGAWLDWTTWELSGTSQRETSTLDLEQSYGQLSWSKDPKVVMRVRADRRHHLRAAVLEEFDGVAFVDDGPVRYAELPIVGGEITVPGADDGTGEVEEISVELESTRTSLILSPGRALGVKGDLTGEAALLGESVRIDPALERGAGYAVEAVIPTAGPDELLDAPAPRSTLPARLTEIRDGPGGVSIDVPLWGSGVERPSPDEFDVYAGVAARAERIAGSATTQYAAVNRIEAHLRRTYEYDEQPPFTASGQMPINQFLDESGRGFCQHFAGSMALMLRTLGIPSRIAVGYTGGRYDPESDEWVVIDRDAHSWVEVYFEGFGWIPFDPTPGRSVETPASVSSGDYAPLPRLARRAGVEREAVNPPSRRADAAPERPDRPSRQSGATGDSARDGGALGWLLLLIPLAAAAALLTRPALRGLRRARRRLRGSERSRVLGAASELESELARLGTRVPPEATGAERAEAIRRATGIDARRLYALADTARYSPGAPAPGTAREAWSESARARREARRRCSLGTRLRASLFAARHLGPGDSLRA